MNTHLTSNYLPEYDEIPTEVDETTAGVLVEAYVYDNNEEE